MKPELKKLLILNAPYLLFVYLFDKIGQAVRLAPGADLSGKVLSLADGFSAAFATPLPSLAPMDLLKRNYLYPLFSTNRIRPFCVEPYGRCAMTLFFYWRKSSDHHHAGEQV